MLNDLQTALLLTAVLAWSAISAPATTRPCNGQTATIVMKNYGQTQTVKACVSDLHITKKEVVLTTIDGIFKGGFERG